MPLFGKIIAHGLVVGTHRGQLDGGVGEVQVRMLQLIQHRLCRWRAVVEQITGEGHCQREFSASLRTAEHQRMRQTVFLHHLHQPFLSFLLSYNLTKRHISNH